MNKKLKGALQLLASVGLGVLLVWLATRKLSENDIAEISGAFARVDYRWLILGPLIGFFSGFSRAERWRMLLEPVGYRPAYMNTFYSVMIMYFANLAFPRLGEVARCGILNKYEKVPLDKAIGTMVTERIIDMISILLVGLWLFFAEHDRLLTYFETLQKGKSGGGGGALLLGILCAAGLAFVFAIFRFKERVSFFKRIVQLIQGVWEGVQSIRYVSNPIMFIVHSVLIWVSYFLMIYLSFFALSETSALGIQAGWACLFFGGFAMAATQGGIGAYPLAIQQVLLLYGIGSNIGLAFGWVVWTVQTISVLLGGLVSVGLLALSNRNR